MKYEITIRELSEFTEEELKEASRNVMKGIGEWRDRYSDKPFHEVRVLSAEVSKEEFEAVKKAIIGIM